MAALSNTLKNPLIDWLLRAQPYSPPATRYIGLLTCTKGTVGRITAYALNDTATVVVNGRNYLYKCTTAGTTGAVAPAGGAAYAGANNEVITDGTAVFTEQHDALCAGTAIVEPSGGGYARVGVSCSLANWAGTQGAGTTAASTGTNGTTSNNSAITFPAPTASWTGSGQVWGCAMFSAATGTCRPPPVSQPSMHARAGMSSPQFAARPPRCTPWRGSTSRPCRVCQLFTTTATSIRRAGAFHEPIQAHQRIHPLRLRCLGHAGKRRDDHLHHFRHCKR